MAKSSRLALAKYIDADEIDAYLEDAPEAIEAKVELGTQVVEYARSIAPEDQGDYKDGIVVIRRGKSGVGVDFTDEISNLVEYGTEDTPEFAVRARTIAYFGGTGDE